MAAEVNIIVRAKDEASSVFHRIIATAGGILTAGVFQQIGAGIVDLGKQGLNAVANFERLGMTMQNLAARELLNNGTARDMAEALGLASEKGKELLNSSATIRPRPPGTWRARAS